MRSRNSKVPQTTSKTISAFSKLIWLKRTGQCEWIEMGRHRKNVSSFLLWKLDEICWIYWRYEPADGTSETDLKSSACTILSSFMHSFQKYFISFLFDPLQKTVRVLSGWKICFWSNLGETICNIFQILSIIQYTIIIHLIVNTYFEQDNSNQISPFSANNSISNGNQLFQ